MKKTLFTLLIAGASLTILSSCGGSGGSGNSLANDAISKAETEIKADGNTIIGTVPFRLC